MGQSGSTLDHRLKEHKRYLTADLAYNTSAVAAHALKFNHIIDWDNAKVIDSNPKLYPLCYLESWHIKSKNSTMNRDEGLLPPLYNSLISSTSCRL